MGAGSKLISSTNPNHKPILNTMKLHSMKIKSLWLWKKTSLRMESSSATTHKGNNPQQLIKVTTPTPQPQPTTKKTPLTFPSTTVPPLQTFVQTINPSGFIFFHNSPKATFKHIFTNAISLKNNPYPQNLTLNPLFAALSHRRTGFHTKNLYPKMIS